MKRLEKGTLIIGFDYELQHGADASRHYKGDWGIKDYENTEQLLEALKRQDLKTIFYCLGEAAREGDLPYKAPKQIQKIRKQGHEIGSHGLEHKSILEMSYPELKKDLFESRRHIEILLDEKVYSFSMPWNEPKQFLRKLAFAVPPNVNKPDIEDVLRACGETGYKTCRVYYNAFWEHMQSLAAARKFVFEPEFFGNVLALRVSTVRAFEKSSLALVDDAIKHRKICFLTTHPHSFLGDSNISIKEFNSFLEEIKKREEKGKLWVATPKEIYDYLAGQ